MIRTDLQRVLKMRFRHFGFVGFQISHARAVGRFCMQDEVGRLAWGDG